MRLAGQPLHVMLAHFPVALLITGAAFDAVTLAGFDLRQAAYWTMLAGLAAALPTAATGMIDWARLDRPDPAVRTLVARHLLLVGAAVVTFTGAMMLRDQGQLGWVVVCDAAGALILGVGAWHGGELVLRHGIGTAARGGVTDHDRAPSNDA